MELEGTDVIININETWKNLARYNKVSWSKVNEFDTCPGQWFVKNFANITNVESATLEHTRAIPGTLIQKMFEVFVNERVYTRPEMNILPRVHDWFYTNTEHLFDLLTFPVDVQHEPHMLKSRYFFRRKEGKSRVASFHVRGLDPVFRKGIQPNFIDWDFFNCEHGSREKFLERINSMYAPILELFVQYDINLNKMFSEIFIEAPLTDSNSITGQVDFIYNKHQPIGYFDTITKVESGFIIIDGKFRVSKYVKQEQLMFYAALISSKFGKLPGAIGFLDWSKAQFDFRDINPHYLDSLRGKVGKISEEGLKLRNTLNAVQRSGANDTISLYDLKSIEYLPSVGNCIFCPIKKVCKPAAEVNTQAISEGIKNKRECQQFLRNQELDPTEDIHEVKLDGGE